MSRLYQCCRLVEQVTGDYDALQNAEAIQCILQAVEGEPLPPLQEGETFSITEVDLKQVSAALGCMHVALYAAQSHCRCLHLRLCMLSNCSRQECGLQRAFQVPSSSTALHFTC